MALWLAAPAAGHHQEGHSNNAGGESSTAASPSDQAGEKGNSTTSETTTHGSQPSCTNTHDASFTGNGSNTSGAYDSTCDGSASLNGNGESGDGRPCAGCVGSADNQNMRGQMPDASDHNKGYECDGNSGIARGNPAHTACPPVTPPPGPPPPPPPPPPPSVKVLGEVERPVAVAPVEVEQEELAFTGMTSEPLIFAALGLAALGGVLILAGRKRTASS
jgi:hypothetical protein